VKLAFSVTAWLLVVVLLTMLRSAVGVILMTTIAVAVIAVATSGVL